MVFYFHLVCFNFFISYSVLPFYLVYVFQFLCLFFLLLFSEVFIKMMTNWFWFNKKELLLQGWKGAFLNVCFIDVVIAIFYIKLK